MEPGEIFKSVDKGHGTEFPRTDGTLGSTPTYER